jgi:hypothetical protein
VPALALAAVLAEPELEVAGAGKLLCELALKVADHRLVVPVPGPQVRVFPGLFDAYPGQQVSRLDHRVVAVAQQHQPRHRVRGETLRRLSIDHPLDAVCRRRLHGRLLN